MQEKQRRKEVTLVEIAFGPNTSGWDGSKRNILVKRLKTKLEEMLINGEIHFELTDSPVTHFMPYVDDLFIEGVSIRNIKNLSNEDELKLKSICNNIYRDVMQPGRLS
jgi:hypothetical protein